MMVFNIVDFSCGGDGRTALYIDNELNIQGDEYHDDIASYILGYCDCADNHFDGNVEFVYWELAHHTDENWVKYNEMESIPNKFNKIESELVCV